MADFIAAFNITMQTEGGYNPGNGEAETYMGIDRSQNSGWNGWPIIDSVKTANPGASISALNALFSTNTDLQADIQQFYNVNYWNTLQLDTINDQQVANASFDCSVNPCIIPASKAAQMACNAVVQQSVTVDGAVGSLTIGCINSLPPQFIPNCI